MNSDQETDDEVLTPPDASRVAARALTLSLVTCRGFIERDAGKADQFWASVLEWFKGLEIDEEAESWERQVLETPLGSLDKQLEVNAQWLCEGLIVIAWALNRHELPAHDEQVSAAKVGNSLGFAAPIEATVLHRPTLRPAEELLALRETYFSLHWRLRNFKHDPKGMDFEDFAKSAWFGPLSLEGLRLIEGDLAVGERPLCKADPESVRGLLSVA